MKKKIIFMIIISIFFILLATKVKAMTITDFVNDTTYVLDDGTLNINSENAVAWVNKYLQIEYDSKVDDDDDAKFLAEISQTLANRLDPKNKKYAADIYSALYSQKKKTDNTTLVDSVKSKMTEFKNTFKKAGKKDIAKEFEKAETKAETTKDNSSKRDEQESKNHNTLTGDDEKEKEDEEEKNNKIYNQPGIVSAGNASATLDDMITDADSFISDSKGKTINATDLQEFSSTIYNIALQVGIGVAVVVGLALGIQFMLSSVEGKADVKKALVVYVIGCIAIFGAFGIWKLIIEVMKQI